MSSFALSSIVAQTRATVNGVSAQKRVNTFRRRWVHNSLRKQAIMMPSLSPFATEGTITRWKIKEGESFSPGDVLLQIENDTGMCDVEACSPGIMGKILTPDGTNHVPVEAVIAIVARNADELASIQAQSIAPTPPPFIQTPSFASISGASPTPRQYEFKLPAMMSPRTPTMSPRTPSLFEKQMMGYGYRSAHVGGPHGAPKSPSTLRLDIPPPCPASPKTQAELDAGIATPGTAHTPLSATYAFPRSNAADETQMDGAALRRMILSNLTAKNQRNPEVEGIA